MAPLLEVESITKDFGGLRALSHVSLSVDRGEICGLIGPNGSGKTTLFNIVSGFTRPTRGKVTFLQEGITKERPENIALKGLVRTFQETRLFGGMSVLDNVLVAYIASSKNAGVRQKELLGKGLALLEFVGLAEQRAHLGHDLTFGQGRKLGIALALAMEPQLLCLDEPLAGLNSTEIVELEELFSNIHQRGLTLWIIDHNVSFLMPVCQRIIVLDSGIKVAEGSPEEVAENEKVIEVYLGKKFARTRGS